MAPISSTRLHIRNGRVAGLLGAAVLACALAMLFAAPAQAASHHIVIKQYAYSPRALSVSQGDTVTWTNQDSVAHDVEVTKGPATFHSPMLKKGQSWSFTFKTAGAYSYICSVHPDMTASISVAAAPAPAHTHAAAVATTPAAAAAKSDGAKKSDTAASSDTATTAVPVTTSADQAAAAAAATPESTSSLDPLLLVAGTSVAVVVFCLLMMTSRPVAAVVPTKVVDRAPVGRHEVVDQL